jgi:hypothetical protein
MPVGFRRFGAAAKGKKQAAQHQPKALGSAKKLTQSRRSNWRKCAKNAKEKLYKKEVLRGLEVMVKARKLPPLPNDYAQP